MHRNKECIEVRKQNQPRYDLGYDHAEMRGIINTNIDKNVGNKHGNKLLEATICCLKFMHNRFQQITLILDQIFLLYHNDVQILDIGDMIHYWIQNIAI